MLLFFIFNANNVDVVKEIITSYNSEKFHNFSKKKNKQYLPYTQRLKTKNPVAQKSLVFPKRLLWMNILIFQNR